MTDAYEEAARYLFNLPPAELSPTMLIPAFLYKNNMISIKDATGMLFVADVESWLETNRNFPEID